MLLVLAAGMAATPASAIEPLPSWNEEGTRSALLAFVESVARPGRASFVSEPDRIAVFDLDGTLLCEKPNYLGSLVAYARLREKADADPGLLEQPLYRAAHEHDETYLKRHYRDVYLESFKGETHAAYQAFAWNFMTRERHPRFGQPYSALFFAPMKELVGYLQEHAFRVFVVSTSNQEFIRSFSERCLGVPAEHVIGSMVAVEPGEQPGTFLRQAAWLPPYNADRGKALRIRERIGRRPVFACGNGNGDLAMLELADANPLPHLVTVIDHDDPEREYEYHRERLLKAAEQKGWPVISMQRDFREVFEAGAADAESRAPAATVSTGP